MNTLIAITAAGVLALLAEIAGVRKGRFVAALVALAAVFVINALDWDTGRSYFHGMLVFDNYAVAFSGLLILLGFLWFLMSRRFFSDTPEASEHYGLVFFSLAGGVVLTGFGDLTMLFIGIEILSISAYILAGSDKRSKRSNEAALKYFLLGAFATGFLLFGIALLYGVTGTFQMRQISGWLLSHGDSVPASFNAGLLLVAAGLAFKVAAVPFHFWAPDVYEGSPTPVTAYMAALVKTAAFAAFYRMFVTCFALVHDQWATVIAVLAAATMLAGNLLAVGQQGLKRQLAYSSIAHAGYMLMAIVALDRTSPGALLYYAASYSVASLGVFRLVQAMGTGEKIASLRGFAKRNPGPAAFLSVLVLSLAGLPPFAGFFGKYYLFLGAFHSGFGWLVLLAILSSLVGVYYYLRIIMTMYAPEEAEGEKVYSPASLRILLIFSVLLVIWLGFMPGLFIDLL